MSGGPVEMMLLNAAIGGGVSAATGGDPLKGALLGGITGGITGGINPATVAGETGTTQIPMALAREQAANIPLNNLSAFVPQAPVSAATAMPAAAAELAVPLDIAAKKITLPPVSGPPGSAAYLNAEASNIQIPLSGTGVGPMAPSAAPNMSPAAFGETPFSLANINAADAGMVGAPSTGGSAATSFETKPAIPKSGGDMFSGLKDWYGSLSKGQQLGVLGAGGIGALMLGERMMAPKAPSGAYEGPLKKFRFDIAGYRPSMMADGGIASLRGADITVGGGMPRANPMGGADSGMLDWQQRSTPTTYMASGGISDLGSYSDGGRMLRGPGDGMSDNIPGVIGGKQPARLADGEFVVPADVVSHLGNGSTDAGAKQLYSMMDRVRKARTGTKKQGRQINPMRQMPA